MANDFKYQGWFNQVVDFHQTFRPASLISWPRYGNKSGAYKNEKEFIDVQSYNTPLGSCFFFRLNLDILVGLLC